MLRKLILGLALALLSQPVLAQSECSQEHVLKPGETLLSVAEKYYGDRSRWSVIYYANESALAGNLIDIPEGIRLKVPCIKKISKPDPTPLLQKDAGIRFLTGSNYAPFTDKNWPGQGMITELINAAMEESPSPVPFSITWEDDWSKHLFPLLDNKEYDMGFPWLKPDCEADPENERCANFHFSDPIFKILVLLYVPFDKPVKFTKDRDLEGKTLCRPKGYFTHDLDRKGRKWLTKKLIKLVQPDSPEDCFNLLVKGKVDAVTLNEFLGWRKIQEMGLKGKVVTAQRPISSESLHVIISKRHWRGTTHLYRFNAGLKKLKQTKRYEEIVSRHLGIFWGGLE